MVDVSIAEAKNGLPKLVDRVLDGEQIVITRHGHRVAELRRASAAPKGAPSHYELLKRERRSRTAVDISSVELLRAMYEDDE